MKNILDEKLSGIPGVSHLTGGQEGSITTGAVLGCCYWRSSQNSLLFIINFSSRHMIRRKSKIYKLVLGTFICCQFFVHLSRRRNLHCTSRRSRIKYNISTNPTCRNDQRIAIWQCKKPVWEWRIWTHLVTGRCYSCRPKCACRHTHKADVQKEQYGMYWFQTKQVPSRKLFLSSMVLRLRYFGMSACMRSKWLFAELRKASIFPPCQNVSNGCRRLACRQRNGLSRRLACRAKHVDRFVSGMDMLQRCMIKPLLLDQTFSDIFNIFFNLSSSSCSNIPAV